MWIEQALELVMDVIEKMTHSLKRARNMERYFKLNFSPFEWKN
jgi:hypothetical protein